MPRLTREEFMSRQADAEARVKRCQIVPWRLFGGLYFAMFVAIPGLVVCECILILRNAPYLDRMLVFVLGVFCVVLSGIMQYQLGKARRIAKAAVNELDLRCPSCRQSLYRQMGGRKTECPHCGAKVFDL